MPGSAGKFYQQAGDTGIVVLGSPVNLADLKPEIGAFPVFYLQTQRGNVNILGQNGVLQQFGVCHALRLLSWCMSSTMPALYSTFEFLSMGF
jgi:hypothetical protein